MAGLGSLVVHLAANTAAFSKDLGKAAHEAEKRMKDIGDAAEKAAKFISAAFLAGVGTAAVLTKQAINSADAMTKLAQSAGIAVERLTELSYAGDLAGVGVDTMGSAVARLNRNIIDADSNMGEAIRGFDALGIKVRDNNGELKNADDIMAEVADKFAEIEDGAGKAAIAQLLFGRSGAQLIPLLNGGSAGLREAAHEARQLGLVFSKEVGKAAEQFNDNLTRLNYAKKGLANAIMVTLLPAMNQLTDEMVSAAKAGGAFDSVAKGALIVFQTLAVLVANVSYVLKQMGMEIGAIAAQAAALARLDFDAFSFIREEHVAQAKKAREELDKYEQRIMSMGTATANAAKNQEKLNEANKKRAAPKVENTTDLMARQKLIEKAQEDEIRGWVKIAEERAAQNVKEAEDLAKATLDRIRFLEDATRTEAEIERESYDMRLFDLQDALDRQIITYEKYQQLMEQATAEHEGRMSDISLKGLSEREKFQRKSLGDQVSTVFGHLEQITQGVSQHNRTLFNINKVAGIANAIINAYEGISKTLATYPYPLSIAMAALQGAAAFAQVSAIASTSFGQTSAAPSLAGSTAAPPVQPVETGRASSGTTTVVNLHGDTFSRQTVRDFLEQLNENSRDGGRVVVNS